MSSILIKNGHLMDPAEGLDQMADLLIEDGIITEIGQINSRAEEVIEAKGRLVIPGATDLHVHLRDFGQAQKETIESGTRAALEGGVTTVLAMPNTIPPLDSAGNIRAYQEKASQTAHIQVLIVGAITKGLKGKELAPLEEYPALGVRFVSDDGFDVEDEALLEQAYRKCAELDLTLITHPEMHSIAPDGALNEGDVSKKLGVPGQPNEKEWCAVERGLRLAAKTNARAHFTHISTKESVELVRNAKATGQKVTCDATPHHFTLTDEVALTQGTFAKVNPPLRTEADRMAIIEGLRDGTIDFIATDHAPHAEEDKTKDWITSAFGISQIDTSVATSITELHFRQGLPLARVVDLISTAPAAFAGLQKGLRVGSKADMVIIDLETEKMVNSQNFISKGHNTPFEGMTLKGWPTRTVL